MEGEGRKTYTEPNKREKRDVSRQRERERERGSRGGRRNRRYRAGGYIGIGIGITRFAGLVYMIYSEISITAILNSKEMTFIVLYTISKHSITFIDVWWQSANKNLSGETWCVVLV